MLTRRFVDVVGSVVDPYQIGFIPYKQILDKIPLASELMQGYGRKGLSPRCMIKVDLGKAYDSLECPFLRAMMIELGIPRKIVEWLMACVSIVSFSVLVNECQWSHFRLKRG